MKSKLKFSTVVALFLATSSCLCLAQLGGGGGQPVFNPATGQFQNSPGQPQAFDPVTGQPIPPGADWKDSNWKDPDITVTNISYDGLPLSEVARSLGDQFKEQFDILLPSAGSRMMNVNGQQITVGWQNDWPSEPISLRLKNVTASEIFAAMNLLFENNRTPLRWELKVNGRRQIALLRVLVDPMPQGQVNAQPPEIKRRVYFVGNLIGDEKNGGLSMEQIIKTITDVWKMADASGGNIQFHKEAQLLVVSGTQSQIDFMEQTLQALSEKMNLQNSQPGRPLRYAPKPARSGSSTNE
jgi:hypothetical protein